MEFDFSTFKRAFEAQDLEAWAACFHVDGEWIEYRHDKPPSKPHVMKGREAIAAFLPVVRASTRSLAIEDEMGAGGRYAFRAVVTFADGARMISHVMLYVENGLIMRQVDVEGLGLMHKVNGIGGLFFRAKDPEALGKWYAEHLGVGRGADRPWTQEAGMTEFAPFKQDTDYFPADKAFMLNFRVADLDAMIAQLQAAGIAVETREEWITEYGNFARIHDPEGTPIELWQPPVE